MPLLSMAHAALQFGSVLTYNNKLNSDLALHSARICAAVKRADVSPIRDTITFIRNAEYGAGILRQILLPTATLVPVPGSAPYLAGQIRPPVTICEQLVAAGLGREVSPMLTRTIAVPKSAYQPPPLRPTVNTHVESMAVQSSGLIIPTSIVLVDDVLTQGRMLYASYLKVRSVFPTAPIVTFSLIRTMNFVPELKQIIDPVLGTITYDGSTTSRSNNSFP